MSMRVIVETAHTEAEITRRKEELVRYMAWRSPDTLKTYEHYFKSIGYYDIQDQVHQSLERDVLTYVESSAPGLGEPNKESAYATRQAPATKEQPTCSGWTKLLALGGHPAHD